MRQTELTADPGNGHRWVLPGVGTFLRTGRVSRAATAEANGRRWEINRFGLVRTGFRACDEAGAVVGVVRNRLTGRSEQLRWAGRDFGLRLEEPRRDGYVLLDGERRLAVMTAKRTGKRPLDVVLEEDDADPGLLLFVAFIVQAYADDASFPAGPSPPTG